MLCLPFQLSFCWKDSSNTILKMESAGMGTFAKKYAKLEATKNFVNTTQNGG